MAIDTSFLFKQTGSTQPEKRAAAIQDAAAQQDDQLITGTQPSSMPLLSSRRQPILLITLPLDSRLLPVRLLKRQREPA